MPFPPRNRCPLSITDIRTGARRTVLPPPGMVWSSYSDAAFSPDGRQLAAIARPPLDVGPKSASPRISVAPGTVSATVVLIDAATGKQTRHGISTWQGAASPSWSPNGSLLFFVRDQTRLGYFNVAYPTGPVREVSVPWADSYMIAPHPTPTPTSTQTVAPLPSDVVPDLLGLQPDIPGDVDRIRCFHRTPRDPPFDTEDGSANTPVWVIEMRGSFTATQRAPSGADFHGTVGDP